MGFVFKTAEERNATISGPTPEQTRIEELEAKLAEVEQFIDENTLLQKFYAWQAIKEAISSGKIVLDDNITDVNFEEVK